MCPRRTYPGTSPRESIAWESESGAGWDVRQRRREGAAGNRRLRRLEKSDGDMGALGRLTLGTPGGRSSAHPCTSKAWATEIPRCRSPRTCSPSRCDTRDVGSRAPRWSWSAFFSLDQTGGSACGCVLIAPFSSSFCAVSRVGVTPWVNRGGLYPSCVHASTVPETSGVSSPPFDTENQRPGEAERYRRDAKKYRGEKRSARVSVSNALSAHDPLVSSLRPPPCLCAPRRA